MATTSYVSTCRCGDVFAAHSIAEAVRASGCTRMVISGCMEKLSVGTRHAGRWHFTEVEIEQIKTCASAMQRERASRRARRYV